MLAGISALQNIVGTQRPVGTENAAAGTTGASFSAALESSALRTIGALEHAEALSFEGLKGGIETREVVDAVMSAEQQLQAAIAIRDKIVTAYLEISRMQI